MSKTIFTSLSPNAQADDIRLSTKLLFQPWLWKKGECVNIIEDKFKDYFKKEYSFSFVSGRGCLDSILSSLNLNANDEVLLQAYTCVATIEPVLWNKAKPVYVDINAESLNMDVDDLKKKITKNSKVLIIQHTFGNPAYLNELVQMAQENNLFVVEDCAHALGSEYNGQKVGTFGDAAFFSFGRDKVISSVYGGMVVTDDAQIAEKIKQFHRDSNYPSIIWIKQQLLHPIIMSFSKKVYSFLSLGKIIIAISKKIKLTSMAVQTIEKSGGKPKFISNRLPNAMACLAVQQFNKLENFNYHRIEIADYYNEKLNTNKIKKQVTEKCSKNIYIRYCIQIEDPTNLINEIKQERILLDDWYSVPIAPKGVNYDKIYYKKGTCPIAERVASRSCNLPTSIGINKKDAEKIVEFINKKYND